jgi:hypothetical protein
LLGSEIIFTHPPPTLQPEDNRDAHIPRPNRLQHVALTSKRIQFKQVQLKPKSDPSSTANEPTAEEPGTQMKKRNKGKGKEKEKADESTVDAPTMEKESDLMEVDDDDEVD